MAKLRINGDSSGYVDLEAPNAASSSTLDLDQIPQKNAANTFSANTQVITAASDAEALHIKGRSSDDIGQIKFMENDGTTSLGRLDARTTKFEMASYSELHLSANGPNKAHLKIDTSGRVTTPSQPSVMVYRNGGNYNVGAGQTVSIIYDTARYNTGGHFNNSNYRFTAPIDGLYNFSGSVNHYNLPAGTRLRIQLHLNGQLTIMGGYIRIYDTGDHNVVFNSSLKLSANDYVEMKRYSDGASAAGTSSGQLWNWFSGYLIG